MRSGALDVVIKNDGKHGITDDIRTMLREYPDRDDNAFYPGTSQGTLKRVISYRGNRQHSFSFAFNGLLNWLNDTPVEELMNGQYVVTTTPWAGIKIPGGTNNKVRAKFYLGMINNSPALISEDFDFVKIPVGKGNKHAETFLKAPLFYRAFASAMLDNLAREIASADLIKYARNLTHLSYEENRRFRMDKDMALTNKWARIDDGKLTAKKIFSWEADMLSA